MTSTVPAPGLSAWAEPHAPLPPALAAVAVPESSVQQAVLPQQVSEAEAAEPPVLRAYQAVSLADSLFRLPLVRTREGDIQDLRKDMGFNHIDPAMRNPLS